MQDPPKTASERRGIAFFDLDHTLLDGDSDSSFLDLLGQSGVVSRAILEAKDAISDAYMEGRPWQDDYRALLQRIYAGRDVAPLEELAREHAERFALPLQFRGAAALIAKERARRTEIVLLTTTNQLVAGPIARALGFDHLLSTVLLVEGACFTGGIAGDTFCTGPGKRDALLAHCAARGVDPADCAMYGDGRSDMDALFAVGEPVAVHPNGELAEVAQRQGWPVLDLAG